jgi:hypothetical protein
MPKPKPIALAIVICDTVIDDRKTGKKSLIGIFDNIFSKNVPCTHPCLNVFIALTQGIGKYKTEVHCIKSDDNKEIFKGQGEINFSDRKQRIEFNFELRGLTFPEYGEYRFEVLCDNQLIIGRTFNITQMVKR